MEIRHAIYLDVGKSFNVEQLDGITEMIPQTLEPERYRAFAVAFVRGLCNLPL
jgi:hypothetical protein